MVLSQPGRYKKLADNLQAKEVLLARVKDEVTRDAAAHIREAEMHARDGGLEVAGARLAPQLSSRLSREVAVERAEIDRGRQI